MPRCARRTFSRQQCSRDISTWGANLRRSLLRARHCAPLPQPPPSPTADRRPPTADRRRRRRRRRRPTSTPPAPARRPHPIPPLPSPTRRHERARRARSAAGPLRARHHRAPAVGGARPPPPAHARQPAVRPRALPRLQLVHGRVRPPPSGGRRRRGRRPARRARSASATAAVILLLLRGGCGCRRRRAARRARAHALSHGGRRRVRHVAADAKRRAGAARLGRGARVPPAGGEVVPRLLHLLRHAAPAPGAVHPRLQGDVRLHHQPQRRHGAVPVRLRPPGRGALRAAPVPRAAAHHRQLCGHVQAARVRRGAAAPPQVLRVRAAAVPVGAAGRAVAAELRHHDGGDAPGPGAAAVGGVGGPAAVQAVALRLGARHELVRGAHGGVGGVDVHARGERALAVADGGHARVGGRGGGERGGAAAGAERAADAAAELAVEHGAQRDGDADVDAQQQPGGQPAAAARRGAAGRGNGLRAAVRHERGGRAAAAGRRADGGVPGGARVAPGPAVLGAAGARRGARGGGGGDGGQRAGGAAARVLPRRRAVAVDAARPQPAHDAGGAALAGARVSRTWRTYARWRAPAEGARARGGRMCGARGGGGAQRGARARACSTWRAAARVTRAARAPPNARAPSPRGARAFAAPPASARRRRPPSRAAVSPPPPADRAWLFCGRRRGVEPARLPLRARRRRHRQPLVRACCVAPAAQASQPSRPPSPPVSTLFQPCPPSRSRPRPPRPPPPRALRIRDAVASSPDVNSPAHAALALARRLCVAARVAAARVRRAVARRRAARRDAHAGHREADAHVTGPHQSTAVTHDSVTAARRAPAQHGQSPSSPAAHSASPSRAPQCAAHAPAAIGACGGRRRHQPPRRACDPQSRGGVARATEAKGVDEESGERELFAQEPCVHA
ncbi:LigA [Gracilaria domingensis]|nr:LigA [Gracilaria domingensis]